MKKFILAVTVIFFCGQLIAQAPVTVTLTTTNSNCSNPCSGAISPQINNGSGHYTYQWSNGANTSAITGLCAGNYSVTVTDSLRCAQSHGINCTASASTNTYAGAFSSTNSNFNNTAIAGGDYIWFNSIFHVGGLNNTTPVTITFTGQTISCGSFIIAVPDATITISPSTNTASTSYNGAQWVSAFPSHLGGNFFLSGAEYLVPHAGLPGNLGPVTWKGFMSASVAGIQVQWQWGAAVYTSFSPNMNTVGVKPVDDPHASIYNNGDHAGAPENYKRFVINGGTGNGGANYIGNYSPNVNVTPCAYPTPGTFGACGYPDSSNLPRSADVFNESDVLAFADLGSGCNIFRAWYNDEHALTLGIRQVNIKTHSGTRTTNYPVSAYPGTPGCISNPQVGSTIQTGPQSGNDMAAGGGRPMWPALFITDVTRNAGNRSGDWQQGGTGYAPTSVCGTWKAAVKTVDSTTSSVTVTVTPDADPAQNNWHTGNSDTPSIGFSKLNNEGYGTELVWDLNAMGINIIPGHLYRIELMVHDGDQNHTGGDVGEMCIEETFGGVVVTGGNLTCGSDSIQLTAISTSPGAVYHWSGPNGFTSTLQNPLVNVAGSYSVTVTSPGNGCSGGSTSTAVAVAVVTQTSVITENVVAKGGCSGLSDGSGSVSVSGGASPYSYAWSTGATTDTITGLSAGTYRVTVTDHSGCSVSASFSITEPQFAFQIIDSSELDASCYGDADGLAEMINCATGGTPPYSYLWSTGDTTIFADGLRAGSYSVTVRDANNCTGVASMTIGQPTPLTASITGTEPSCYLGANGSADVLVTGGMGFNTYLWSNGETKSPATGLGAGPYSVTVTDQNNCTALASVTINQPPLLTASVTSTGASCSTCSDGSAEVKPGGGSNGDTYQWNTGATTQSISGISPGSYSVTVTDGNGCTASATGTVASHKEIVISANGKDPEISLYPNPFAKQFHYSLKNPGINPISLKIYDLLGKVVMESADVQAESDIVMGDNYATGIYLLKIEQGNFKQVIRVIKE